MPVVLAVVLVVLGNAPELAASYTVVGLLLAYCDVSRLGLVANVLSTAAVNDAGDCTGVIPAPGDGPPTVRLTGGVPVTLTSGWAGRMNAGYPAALIACTLL